MSVNPPLLGDTEGVSAAVHPHLATAIRLCISFDPDQAVKENLFGEEILDLLTADESYVSAGDLDWTSRTFGEAFDLTVEGLHTYFVDFGEGSVLVHNTDCTFAELGGKSAYVDRADLIDGVVEHAAARGRTVLPSEIDNALSTTSTRIRDGLPGRDNAVRFEFEDLIVIIKMRTRRGRARRSSDRE